MSELRHDPLSKRWVIIANERSRRPEDFTDGFEARSEGGFCPFCPGSEDKTPGEIAALRPGGGPANGPGWEVRVIPNKYPALSIEGTLDRQGLGLYDRMRGVGAHEVVIESPRHDLHIGDMAPGVLEGVLGLCQERMSDLGRDPRFKYVLLFKNHGAAAGATLSHPHMQLIATPVTPRAISVELDSAREHFHLKERCIFCDMLEQEIQSRDRVVSLDEHFAVLAPYASRFPFELMIMPRRHNHAFTDESRLTLAALARTLQERSSRSAVQLRAARRSQHRDARAPPALLGHAALRFPLAHRDPPAFDARGGVRMGFGFLHQSDRSGRGRGLPPRRGDLRPIGPPIPPPETPRDAYNGHGFSRSGITDHGALVDCETEEGR